MRMKSVCAALLALAVIGAVADSKIEAGPRGGRLLETDAPRPEFFVEKDRTVTIALYDASKKETPVASQRAVAIAEAGAAKTKLEFEKKAGKLVSKSPLPEGNGYTVVFQYWADPAGKPKNFRIPLNLEVCGSCKHAEYACTCHE